jgi:gamma-glutamylcyclotransferase (GGCT)/AIG2-like uncharacterized protein YtfP
MLVFVYGTLKKNFDNHKILKKYSLHDTFLEVETVDKFQMLISTWGFPFVLKEPSNKFSEPLHLKGELWEIDDYLIEYLDAFEDVPTLYFRDTINVVFKNKIIKDVYIYFASEIMNTYDNKCIKEFL